MSSCVLLDSPQASLESIYDKYKDSALLSKFSGGVIGLTRCEMRQYLEYVADQRFKLLGLPIRYHARNPFPFMELQDVQELTNFFERRVSACASGGAGRGRIRSGILNAKDQTPAVRHYPFAAPARSILNLSQN